MMRTKAKMLMVLWAWTVLEAGGAWGRWAIKRASVTAGMSAVLAAAVTVPEITTVALRTELVPTSTTLASPSAMVTKVVTLIVPPLPERRQASSLRLLRASPLRLRMAPPMLAMT